MKSILQGSRLFGYVIGKATAAMRMDVAEGRALFTVHWLYVSSYWLQRSEAG